MTGRLNIRDIWLVLVCGAMFVLSAFLDTGNDYFGLAVLTVLMFIAFYDAVKSSLGTIIVFSGVTLFVVPYLSLFYVGEDVQVAWFALFILVSRAFLLFGEPPGDRTEPVEDKALSPAVNFALMIVIMTAGLYATDEEGVAQVGFAVSWALGLVHLERIHRATASPIVRLAGVAIFCVFPLIFALAIWNGYGRIIIAGLFLAPLLLTVHYRTIRLNVVLFAAIAGVLPFLGRIMRFGWSGGLAGISEDSGATHIIVTSMLWGNKALVLNSGSILEQWALLFANWVPRTVWPDKPLGIGLTFVDMFQGRTGLSQEHSTALGYFGEHIFYLPNTWWISVILLTIMLIFMRRAIVRLSDHYAVAVIAFDVSFITLFWGGMAAFGARVWFSVLPILVYLIVLRRIDRRRGRTDIVPRVSEAA